MKVKDIMFLKRLMIYIIGLFSLAFGTTIAINSELGVSPVNSLPYVSSLITGFDLGLTVFLVYLVFLIIQILILRKDFKWINLTQLIFSSIFSYFVDFANLILGDFALPTYFGKLIMLAVSVFLVALGVTLYTGVNIINLPVEGLTAAVQEKYLKKLPFGEVKVVTDSLLVIIAMISSWIFLGEIVGIREGTVICALLVGKVMKPLQKIMLAMNKKIGI